MEIKFEVKLNLNTDLVKAIFKDNTRVSVGILEPQASEPHIGKKGQDVFPTATLGWLHEFGEQGQKERSFIRWPLQDDFNTEWHRFYTDAALLNILLTNKSKFWDIIGKAALRAIDNSFKQGGSTKRKWPELNPRYALTKTSDFILVETAKLRRSITYQVKR